MKFLGWLRIAFTKPDWEKILTPRAKQVLALSRRAAADQKWKCVEVEHLLAGILRLNEGLAVQMLKNAGLEPADLRANLERSGVKGTVSTDAMKIRYGSSIKPCLISACWTAHLELSRLADIIEREVIVRAHPAA